MDNSFSYNLITEANRLRHKYNNSGDPNALDEAISLLVNGTKNPKFLDENEKERARVFVILGTIYISLYVLSQNKDDLTNAFDAFRRAISQFSDEEEGVELGNLIATATRINPPGNDNAEIIQATVVLYDELIDKNVISSELHITLLGNKANAYRQLSELTSNPKHLQQSISIHEFLLDLVEDDSEFRPGYLSNYGNALRQRYLMFGDVGDLEKAIEMQELAISLSSDTGKLDLFHHTLGLSYLEKFEYSRDVFVLQLALKALQNSIKFTPKNSLELISRKLRLGVALRKLYLYNGCESTLNEAISILDDVLVASKVGSSEYYESLSELSSALRNRHDLTGNLFDLQRALETQQKMIDVLDEDSSLLPSQLSNLAILYTKSYSFSRDLNELKIAEDYFLKVINLNKQDDEFIARCYHNLANTQMSLFHDLGLREYLDRAIINRKLSIDRTPDGSNELAARLASLSQDELTLYEICKDLDLLDSAIGRLKIASKMDFQDDVDEAVVWYYLAKVLVIRYEVASQENDQKEAIKFLLRAIEKVKELSTPLYLTVAKSWAYWAMQRQSWDEASEAFQHALKAADTIVNVQSTLLNSANLIDDLDDLYVYASYSFLKSGNLVEAVVTLERGRTQLFSGVYSLRLKKLEQLSKQYPNLAKDALHAYKILDSIYKKEFERLATNPISTLTDELKYAIKIWERSVSQIKKIKGFESFEHKPEINDITELASIKPIVYIAPNYWAGFALIVTASGKVHSVSLPGLSTVRIHKLINQMNKKAILDGDPLGATDGICKWLWENAMGPIISQLENLGIREIFLIPVGILAIFPFHAAWTFDSSQQSGRLYAIDKLVISYIPSVKTALVHLPVSHFPLKSATIIEDPTSTLQFAPEETKNIIQYFPDVKLLGGEAATKSEVLKHLPGRNVLHFSCHGTFNPVAPMKSGLVMAHRDLLTLSDIQLTDINQTSLVTLSSCETGLIGSQLMNEVVGFPMVLMNLGVPNVLSAIWSIHDESTSILMKCFYENLFKNNMSPSQALNDAQKQLRDGRLSTSNFAHPFFWGAFYITGF